MPFLAHTHTHTHTHTHLPTAVSRDKHAHCLGGERWQPAGT